MAIKSNNQKTKQQTKQSVTGKKTFQAKKEDMLDVLDGFFIKHTNAFLYVGMALTFIFSLFLFDVKVGAGGDDSAYILRAFDFVHEFKYPGYQGALYPLVLSLFISLMGIKLILLKSLSFLFMMISMYFFYKTFSGKLPQVVVGVSFILLSVNYFLLYFASQTYSEAFFLMLQALLFWYFATNFIDGSDREIPIKKYFLLGLFLFLLTLTKNIAYAAVAVVVGYFMLEKRWKSILYTLGGFFSFFVPFEILKRILWGSSGLQFSSQGTGLMYKDFYNQSKGKEDFAGFIQRFIDNSNLYFSKHFFKFFGFRSEALDVSPFLTIIVWVILGLALYQAFRKNKLLLFVGLYTVAMCATTFIALQAQWDQWRMIIIVFPLMLLLVFGAVYYSTKSAKMRAYQIVFPVLAIILFFGSFGVTAKNAKTQKDILVHNLGGNVLYGLTPDWENYILMSQWAAKNTPASSFTAVRKADISFIYGGRKFYGITKVPSVTSDSLLKTMTDSMVYVGIRMDKILQTPVFADPAFRAKTVGFINGTFSFGDNQTVDGNVVGVYRFKASELAGWEERIKQTGDFYDVNVKNWLKTLPSITNDYAVYLPDMLLEKLKKDNVKYVMLASLRANPAENTGNIISTLHRFVYFIQLKYPEIFQPVYSIGNSEGAQLLELK
ncbi:MAG: hypothetical protein Q8928_01185 [Bacteroidota bacterium]|nr:hypothetical protein [Bacteroidota bacterium]